jgi:formylglycine-generating enzyme required for sulfatase activity
MKLLFITLIALVVVTALAAAPQEVAKPLNKDQVMDLVMAGMDSATLAAKVQERGIDFDPTEDYLKSLRSAGAKDVLIKALVAAHPKPLSRRQVLELVVGNVPSQRAAALVAQHGIDFVPDDTYFETLRLAGAEDVLIAAVRRAGGVQPVAPGSTRQNPQDGLKYIWIPPGSFLMGCSPGDSECSDNEKPAHQVAISKGLWVGQTEVTVAAYKRFASQTGKALPSEPAFNSGWAQDNLPIVNVSWDDAQAYCHWAGGRLPTEAEWEYAARGGSTEVRYAPLDDVSWYNSTSDSHPHDVAQKRANAYGLYDTLGNVWEWVSDWYDEKYYAQSPGADPSGPATGDVRGLRGGSWKDGAASQRVSDRGRFAPDKGDVDSGLRCVREAAP